MDSIIAWMGGKRLLRKTIGAIIPPDICGYIEPFGGAGWVLFYKDRWAEMEVYNDLDGRLVNLFLQVKYHPEELIREMDLMLSSREMFAQLLNCPGLTEIQRAARFIFLVTRSFGSRMNSFATPGKCGHISSHYNRIERIREMHKRLDKVIIEHLPYQDVLTRYDHKDNFFYLDPPYMTGATYDNSKLFNHQELRDQLIRLKGRWILSYDDVPEAHERYEGYDIMRVERVKGINRKAGKSEYKEVVISNLRKIK